MHPPANIERQLHLVNEWCMATMDFKTGPVEDLKCTTERCSIALTAVSMFLSTSFVFAVAHECRVPEIHVGHLRLISSWEIRPAFP